MILGAVLAIVSAGLCAEIRVPADHATIQSAIDAAGEGDVVIIADGRAGDHPVVEQ